MTMFALVSSVSAGEAWARSKADAVIAAAKRATGGAAWDRPEGCHEEGTRGDGSIAYRTWFSLKRYGMRVESGKGGATQTIGFDGEASWRTDAAGETGVHADPESRREAVVTAYLSNNGFFFPRRFPASFAYLREATQGARTFDVVEIAPVGGYALQVWFDRKTHWIGRVVDDHGAEPVTVEADDYRRAGRFTIAYGLKVFGPGNRLLDQGRVTSFRCDSIDHALFDPPGGR